jgi:hypothetical protein
MGRKGVLAVPNVARRASEQEKWSMETEKPMKTTCNDAEEGQNPEIQPTLAVGKRPYGKSRLNSYDFFADDRIDSVNPSQKIRKHAWSFFARPFYFWVNTCRIYRAIRKCSKFHRANAYSDGFRTAIRF